MTALDVVRRLFVHRPAEWQGFRPGSSPPSPKFRKSYGMPVNSIMKSVFCSLVATLSMFTASAAAPEPIQLGGQWNFALDPNDLGFNQPRENWRFPDTIMLPGVLTAQGFGEKPSMETKWTGDGWRYPELFKEWQQPDNFKFPFFLQPPRHYVGPAWFEKQIEIPESWRGHSVQLHLERVHWQSTVWINGEKAGACDSLGTPHEFALGELPPGAHQLVVRVDNRLAPVNPGPLSHSVTDHTQGNWNGIVGRMELRPRPLSRITGLQIFPSNDGTVLARISGCIDASAGETSVEVWISDGKPNGHEKIGNSGPIEKKADGTFTAEVRLCLDPPPALWSEFHPELYQARARLFTGDDMPVDEMASNFGFREIRSGGGKWTLNGVPLFVRGTLECCIFPLTGHPPTDVESWKRIVRICKAHGLNHIRFHSWCPPEAAFIAADELGFYYQVEVSSWAKQGAEIGSGRPLDGWIENETERMMAAYGNHPSFLLLAYGNEPAGKNHAKWLQDFVAKWKSKDSRRAYTTGAGWPVRPGSDFHSSPNPRLQRWGEGIKSRLNAMPPSTDFNWSDFVRKHADAPVVSHEIGQWCVYPNFDEIKKYTGYFKARNFEIFRETARRNGILPLAADLLHASGKWQAACYKHDIEAALRTPGFGGYQLLDLHDFPGQGTALVGVLDAFWDEKGYIKAEEYARFSGPVVPLAELPKMVWSSEEDLTARLLLSHFGPSDLIGFTARWELRAGGKVLASGKMPKRDLKAGAVHELGSIYVALASVREPVQAELVVGDEVLSIWNHWDVFIYPPAKVEKSPGVFETRRLDDALHSLAEGKVVWWMPEPAAIADDPKRPLVAGFSPMFWNTAWTAWQPPHTLGMLIDQDHPALAAFPTGGHTNWQWWSVQRAARPFILSHAPSHPVIVRPIDDWVSNRPLGYAFEAKVGEGRLFACAFDLRAEAVADPAAKQLRASVLRYLGGESFQPKASLDVAALRSLAKKNEP